MTRRADQDRDLTVARVKAMRGGLAAIDLYLAKLEAALEGPLNSPLNASVREAHRAAHKPGTPSKIDADPQVRAFILDRLDSDRLTDIVAQVKAHFPRDRQVSRSGLHRWWHKKGELLMAKRHQTKPPQSAVTS